MRETKAYCDICKKEFDHFGVYFVVKVVSDGGLISKPAPSSIETCLVVCAKKWLDNLKKGGE